MSEKKIYIHKFLSEHRVNDEKNTTEEFLRDNEKGISFTSMNLTKGKKESYKKVSGKELEDGNFGITIKIDGNVEQKTMSKKDLMALIKKHKELAFIEKYMTKEMEKFRKTLKGGKRRKASKKTSKRASKKSSKKSTRKSSRRKSSKKTSRRASRRKSSKKSASKRKSSRRKASKKSSRRASRRKSSKKSASKRKSSRRKASKKKH